MLGTGKLRAGALVALVLGLSGSLGLRSQTTLTEDVPPELVYCPSTGGCFKSLPEAEQVMRAATKDVGPLLTYDRNYPTYGAPTRYYRVPDQAPKSLGQPLYGTWESMIGDNGHCPNSKAIDNIKNDWGGYYCYDESEMIQSFIRKKASATGCGWNDCVNHDFYVAGDYSFPYDQVRGNWMFWDNASNTKAIFFTETLTHYGTSILRKTNLYKLRPYTCPVGMSPLSTSNRAIYPKLCRSSATASISVRVLRQYASCPAHTNPCHPSSGDKSRAETDFVFAGRPFTRYYHSLREIRGQSTDLGNGWTHAYQARLQPPGLGWRLLTPDGYFAPYSAYSAGTGSRYVATNFGNAVVEQQADKTWRVKERNGDVWTFTDIHGELISLSNTQDPSRNVSLVYEPASTGGSTARRITKLIDAAGRELKFLYGPKDLLIGFVLPDGREINYGYDEHDNLVSVDYGNGQVKRYHYGEANLAPNGDTGLLTGITSENGQRYASFGYDTYGRVKSSVLHGPNGAVDTTYVRYTANNAAEADVNGHIKKYVYTNDVYRKPLTLTDDAGTVTRTYDGDGRVLTSKDARGTLTQNSYTGGRLTQVVEAANDNTGRKRTTQTDWHATLNVPTERRVLDAAGTLVSKETWTYNARGQVLTQSRVDPTTNAARTTTTSYCEAADVTAGTCPLEGLVTSVDGPRTDVNDIVRYRYFMADAADCATAPTTCAYRKGDLQQVTNALGQSTTFLRYDGAGRVLSQQDARGIVTDFTYHPRGWLASRTVRGTDNNSTADDRSTRLEYWPTGLVSFVYQPDGSFTAFTYDDAHRLTGVHDNLGNKIQYTLDKAGNRTKEDTFDANGALTRTLSRVYNQLGQLQQSLTANQHATTFAYDPNGNTIGTQDALGSTSGQAYDPLDRLVQTLQDSNGIRATTKFAYDANDNLTEVTDPKGLKTQYGYNGLGDLLQLSSPDTGITTYTYDEAGNRKSQTDARNVTAQYGYDALGRLREVRYPTAFRNQFYQYDTAAAVCPEGERQSLGQLSHMQSSGGVTSYCYDRWGQLVRKVQEVPGQAALVLRYGYDVFGRLQTTHYPDGGVADLVRNAAGQVVELGYTGAGRARQIIVTQIGYAPFGPSTGWTYGNGRRLDRTLTLDYRPNTIQDTQVGGLSYAYGFDAVGNLGALKNATQTEDLGKFVYDGLNRLTQQQLGNGTPINTWGYDATGNRTRAQNVTNGSQNYTYPDTSHRLTQVGAGWRSMDATGNTLTANGKRYEYNDTGRMVEVWSGGAELAQYGYNAKGEQTSRKAGAITTSMAYDEAGHFVGEYHTDGTPKQQVVWFEDYPVAVLTGSGAQQQMAFVQPDHLGTPRAIIDSTRNVAVWSWPLTGEAFGNTQPDMDPDGDGQLFYFDLRFPGQRYDAYSGLNYNYFRDYEPNTGRYVQSDPIGLKGGSSTFGYVGGNPLTYIDPSGLVKWKGYGAGFDAYAGVGGGIYYYKFESECKCGKKVTVSMHAGLLGIGGGAKIRGWSALKVLLRTVITETPWSVIPQDINVEDGAACPSANAFNGLHTQGNIQILSRQTGRTTFWGPETGPQFFERGGFGLSVNFSAGAAGTWSSTETPCCEK